MIGSNIKLPSVLFIKGVFKRDCISEDVMEKTMMEKINSDTIVIETPQDTYEKLPTIFRSVEQWPTSTKLLCWHCGLSFNEVPVFIPDVIEPAVAKYTDNSYNITVYGVFCCFGDANAFIESSNMKFIDKIEAKNKLRFLYRLFNNASMGDFPSYPNKFDMIQYGGSMSQSRYRELCKSFTR
jgi:hypothetical protein